MTNDDHGPDLGHFFDMSLDLMTVAGLDGYFKKLNRAWSDVLGWERDELLAEPFVSFVHPDDVETTLEQLEGMQHGARAIAFENRYRCRDGSYRWLQWNATPMERWIYAVARDVTRDRDVESSLRRSERFLDSIVENIPNMVFVKDAAELRFVRINRAGEDLLGFSRDELAGKSDFDFFPSDEAEFFVSTDRNVLAVGDVVDIPSERIDTRHRGQRILHTKKIPLHDDHGDPAFLLGIAEDITEWIQDQDQLRHRQETLNAVFDASPDALLVLNRDLRVEDASEAIETIHGFPVADRRGHSPLELVHPDDREILGAALSGLLVGDSIVIDVRCRIRHVDGHWVDVEARGRVLHDGGGQPSGAVVVLRDLTESLAAQEAARRAEVNEAEHRLVEDLQRRALLPPPATEGLEMAAHYQSARSGVGMGGDWYHGLTLDNGNLGLIIGDVVGHGLTAAGDMTQLSGILGTLLRVGTPLEELFGVVDTVVGSLGIMATAVVCEIDASAHTVRHISAGHPPLVIAGADGEVTFLGGGRRPPIGVPTPSPAVAETPLPPGSTLVAYTDGLVERRHEDFEVGMDRLRGALVGTRSLDVCDQLDDIVGRCTADYDTEDDIAVVVVRSLDR